MSITLHTHRQIGTFHTLHCEDDLLTAEIRPDIHLLSVMDGCTMGTDSHLPSTMVAKLLRKITRDLAYTLPPETPDLPALLRAVVQQLFADLRHAKNWLGLNRDELLCTVVLALVNTTDRTAEVIVVGDGWVDVNGQGHEFEQENRPDYLAYHLGEDFGEWYAGHAQKLSCADVRDISLSTDGLLTFAPADASLPPILGHADIAAWLLRTPPVGSNPKWLLQQTRRIAEAHGLQPTDDLAIVRLTC